MSGRKTKRRLRKTNPNLLKLIHELELASVRYQAPLWKDLARRLLERPLRNWAEVNINKISAYASDDDEIIVVPGKVLGDGELTKAVKVAAVKFSAEAVRKIKKAGGTVMNYHELIGLNPKGTRVRILG